MGISESWLWTTVVAHTESVAEEGSGGLSEGDLVWGAARGFPAWPGKLVGPVTDGDKVWVRWFGGDRALTQVPLQSLKTLSEGLEAHHRARKKFRKWVSFALHFIGDVTVFFGSIQHIRNFILRFILMLHIVYTSFITSTCTSPVDSVSVL